MMGTPSTAPAYPLLDCLLARLGRERLDTRVRAHCGVLRISNEERIGTVSFDWSPESKLVSFDAVDEQGQSYTVQF